MLCSLEGRLFAFDVRNHVDFGLFRFARALLLDRLRVLAARSCWRSRSLDGDTRRFGILLFDRVAWRSGSCGRQRRRRRPRVPRRHGLRRWGLAGTAVAVAECGGSEFACGDGGGSRRPARGRSSDDGGGGLSPHCLGDYSLHGCRVCRLCTTPRSPRLFEKACVIVPRIRSPEAADAGHELNFCASAM